MFNTIHNTAFLAQFFNHLVIEKFNGTLDAPPRSLVHDTEGPLSQLLPNGDPVGPQID